MTTARDICSRALSRLRVTGAGESPHAEDAELVLGLLNGMLQQWKGQGVDAKPATLALSDAFTFFVPPVAATAEVIAALEDQGAWNASTNSPALATGTGTLGHFYKVTTAGSTVLDDVTAWDLNSYAVFDGTVWLKSIDPVRFERAVIDLLAIEASVDFGKEPSPLLLRSASDGWRQIQAAYIKPQTAAWDAGLTRTYARPWTVGTST